MPPKSAAAVRGADDQLGLALRSGNRRAPASVGAWLAKIEAAQGGLALDSQLFVAATLFAAITAHNQLQPAHAAWGGIAVWGYAAATVLTLAALLVRHSDAAAPFIGMAGRATLTAATFAATALLPLVVEAVERSDGRLDLAQPEVAVIEAGGERLWHTGTPYLGHQAIAALPPGAQLGAYMPYQPGMALYGLPRTIAGAAWWSDARVWFAAALIITVMTAMWLLRRPGDPVRNRLLLRAVQAMSVLPICALTLATGGDDVAVLGFCVLAFALAAHDRLGAAGVAIGIAGAMKLFAWPIAIVLLALAAARGFSAAVRYALGAAGLPFAVLVPSFLIGADAAIENVIRFPLGFGLVKSPAESPFPGHLIAESVAGGNAVAVALLLAAGVIIGAWVVRHAPRSAARAATMSACGLLVAILLMPSTRFGYLLYPIGLALWAVALSGRKYPYRVSPQIWSRRRVVDPENRSAGDHAVVALNSALAVNRRVFGETVEHEPIAGQ